MSPIEVEHSFTLQNAFDFVNGTKREDVVTLSEVEGDNKITNQKQNKNV